MRSFIISVLVAGLLPCTGILAQDEPCDLNHNGFVDVADVTMYMNMIDGNTLPDDLPFYDPELDCDRDSLHLTINDVVGLYHRMIYGYNWGKGHQWWLPLDSLYIPETEISPGSLVDIPVYMHADHPLTFVQLGFKYDPELLKICEFIVSGSVPEQYPVRGYSAEGLMSAVVQLAPIDEEIHYSGHLGNLRANVLVADPGEIETVIEFYSEPRRAVYNGICSLDYMHDAPSFQLFFTHPTTVDGIIRIVDRDRLGESYDAFSPIAPEAYPNPFNSSVEISLQLESEAQVEVAVFDLLGRQVAQLYDGRLSAGKSNLIWNPVDLPSGIYFCRVHSDGQEVTRRITLLR